MGYRFRKEEAHENRPPIKLSKEEHEQLQGIATSQFLPHGLVNRARINGSLELTLEILLEMTRSYTDKKAWRRSGPGL